MTTVLTAENVRKQFGAFTALDDVSFELTRGTTLGVVGESGSGKSTLGRIAMRLLQPDNGTIRLDGRDLFAMTQRELRTARRRIQLVPQDPRTSLNPSMSVRQNLFFQFRAQRLPRADWEATAHRGLERVSLPIDYLDAYPHQISGGQAQRVAIARAMASDPEVMVCDEAVSALDKSVQAQVLNTLAQVQADSGVSLFFITHDLAVVAHLADEVLVLNHGRVVESGTTAEVLAAPKDPYTRELLAVRATNVAGRP